LFFYACALFYAGGDHCGQDPAEGADVVFANPLSQRQKLGIEERGFVDYALDGF